MIHSMTGYGRAVKTLNGREITVELRSVNNRFLDCTVKLPRAFSYAEDAVKQKVKQSVTRGKVDVFISVNTIEGENVRISLNRPVLEGYLNALRTIAQEYEVRDDVSATSLARFPEVFTVEKPEEDEERNTADIVSVAEEAIAVYNAMRAKEGAALAADLKNHAGIILSYVEKVETRSPVTVAEYRTRLEAKLREVLESKTIDESRILTEAAIFADKVAVDEETVRLRSHLKQLDDLLNAGGPIGRKLDFLLQEMNREANTIGSKGNDLEMTQYVVEIKAELEKIREQIQNIE
ncbi:MAG: YicC family protein [Oscillospiraceae bacterium]|nr:YicC family protein [Oscillospiraceae bacterium]